MIRRAIISVFEKEGIADFARQLDDMGVEILSTGGTAQLLSDAGIRVRGISDVTGFPECLGGRVKTLHPKIHGGILGRRDDPGHQKEMKDLGIAPIDLVVINLYPFRKTVLTPGVRLETCIENIDIGGPAMLRSASKNFAHVTVLTDPADYAQVLAEIRAEGDTRYETRLRLAKKAFELTSEYDSLIASYLWQQVPAEPPPERLTLAFQKVQDLRYGENPHQKAVFYRNAIPVRGGISEARQVNGKDLSYNNIADADAAISIVKEFEAPVMVAIKHANPCGVALGSSVHDAWRRCYEADPVSIYGGVIATNREIDAETAIDMSAVFLEVVVAPSYTHEALNILTQKKNLRLLSLPHITERIPPADREYKRVIGGLLIQDHDTTGIDWDQARVVTRAKPDDALRPDMEFAMLVVKHVRSNAIVLAKNLQTLGIGPGQPNRITSTQIAVRMAGEKARGAILASDAFFPFSDSIEAAAEAGVSVVIQPGGAIRDAEVIAACDAHGIAMIHTGLRHFLH